MLRNHDNVPLRIVTIGDASVGKTSITSYLIDKAFNPFEPSTVGANYQTYSVSLPDERVDLQIWDTAGQEKFKSLGHIYFRNAAAAVVVFSLANRDSFLRLEEWICSFKEAAGNNAIVYIAANKADLDEDFEISAQKAEEWATKEGYKFYMTSAKTGLNIDKMFEDLATDVKNSDIHSTILKRTTIKIEESTRDVCC